MIVGGTSLLTTGWAFGPKNTVNVIASKIRN